METVHPAMLDRASHRRARQIRRDRPRTDRAAFKVTIAQQVRSRLGSRPQDQFQIVDVTFACSLQVHVKQAVERRPAETHIYPIAGMSERPRYRNGTIALAEVAANRPMTGQSHESIIARRQT